MSIRYAITKIKPKPSTERVLLVGIVCCVSLIAYSIGYQDGVRQTNQTPSIIFYDTPSTTVPTGAQIVYASRSGARYYYEGCSGMESIKQSNLIQFASAEIAQAAGYTIAHNCNLGQ